MKVNTDAAVLAALTNVSGVENILEIGTGCGLISLMLAQKNESVKITAIDIDEASVLEADYNFKNSPWCNRLKSLHVALQEYNTQERYDLVISNPPFFQNSLKSETKQVAFARHDDMLSAEIFFAISKNLIKETGGISIIVPNTRVNDFIYQANINSLYLTKRIDIFAKPNIVASRAVLQFGYDNKNFYRQELIIRDTQGNYTQQYETLLKEYLIVF